MVGWLVKRHDNLVGLFNALMYIYNHFKQVNVYLWSIWAIAVKLATVVDGGHEGFFFNSYYIEV